jgi:hypothetical protein
MNLLFLQNNIKQPKIKKILIIQTSPPHTGSTFLINALYGIIEEINNKSICGEWSDNYKNYFGNIIVLKCHNTNIDELIQKYSNEYYLYFVCSERPLLNKHINPKYKLYKNVISFFYKDLLETEQNTLDVIIDNIYNNVKNLLYKHPHIKLNKNNGIQRIINMNKRYIEIKDLPFSYIDPFFELHGSHRNRKE